MDNPNHDVEKAKVTQELNSAHDGASLGQAFQDLKKLSIDSKDSFKTDLAQISKSVDLKAMHLDGFTISNFGNLPNGGTAAEIVQKDSSAAGVDTNSRAILTDKGLIETEGVDAKGKAQLTAVGDVFGQPAGITKALADVRANNTAIDGTGPAAAPKNDQAQAPAGPKSDQAPSPGAPGDQTPPAAAVNAFGVHGRTFDVSEDGKTNSYTAKHGDTYWSVAKDLLSKPDYQPSNKEILAEVNKLAQLNQKDDAGKLKVGEKIVLDLPAPGVPPAAKPGDTPPPPATGKPGDAPPPPAAGKPGDAPPPPAAPKPDVPPPAPAAPLGLDIVKNSAAILPHGDTYNPLSPVGFTGAAIDQTKVHGGHAEVKTSQNGDTVTNSSSFNMNDGYLGDHMFGLGETKVTNKDVVKGGILQSRETGYDAGISLKLSGANGPVSFTGVTSIKTALMDNGNYKTSVHADGGDYSFLSSSSGKVLQSQDNAHVVQNAKLETPAPPTVQAEVAKPPQPVKAAEVAPPPPVAPPAAVARVEVPKAPAQTPPADGTQIITDMP